MSLSTVYSRVNDVLVEIHRSLVQYTVEVICPWTAHSNNNLKRVVTSLAAQQEADVKRLVEYLMSHGQRVDFGVYPQTYSSLHFVEIGYLRSQLIENQQTVIEEIEAAIRDLAGAPICEFVKDVLASQKDALKALLEVQLPVA